jgi:SNF2 family DNA or RNA helicase
MGVQMQWRLNNEAVEVFGTQSGQGISLAALTSTERIHLAAGLARVEAAVLDGEDGVTPLVDGTGYRLSRDFLQSLTSEQAQTLGLPVDVPFSLWVRLSGAFVSPNTKVMLAWHDVSGSPIRTKEEAGILSYGSKSYRVPMSLARIQRASERFNLTQGDLDSRLAIVSELKAALELAAGESLEKDRQLTDMRFRHASAVSLDVAVAKDGVSFDPIFFSEDVRDLAQEGGELVKAAESLLTPELQRRLAQQFRSASVAKATYVLSQGEYLYVDPSLRPALEVIKEYQDRPADERARFAKSPQSFLKERLASSGLSEEESNRAVDLSFVETDAFSERVIEVGLWQPPVLPFVKRAPNNWFPEAFGLKIGTKTVSIPEHQLEPLAKEIASSILNGVADVLVPGISVAIPASREALDAVNAMLELFLKVPRVEIGDKLNPGEGLEDPNKSEPQRDKSILLVQDNFEQESFIAQFSPRDNFLAYESPNAVMTELKEHQREGVEWLQRCWGLGYPGVLLADDMGLGKTLQALAFIAWLRKKRVALGKSKKPILVVAPISLLGNWQSEAAQHLRPGSLGEMACLYGGNLGQFRRAGYQRADVIEGISTLDVTKLKSFDWVLTTYETMRDYHLSLGLVDFALIVFDEMQKVKNPQSMMTNAAQALKGDFKIGLTGTPIENSLADIWTLFDSLMPGALGLGDLRQFMARYRLDAPDALKELKSRLTDSTEGRPAPMLRRMKFDVAKDLPTKIERKVQRPMPEEQSIAYVTALSGAANASGRRGRLDAFHRIRGISLHPNFAQDSSVAGGDDYVSASARLTSCLNLLDEIRAKGEKALVFVESLAMQEWLAFYLKERYQLERHPARIYGDTSADRRTAVVKQFQFAPKGKFDVLLLSPKAAGVGLTLTAATHVIHLTRWWNPAVEDQCTDRAYRIGQTKDVYVYYLQAVHPLYGDGSFDCILDQLLSRKRALSKGMLVPIETGDELDEIFAALAATTL